MDYLPFIFMAVLVAYVVWDRRDTSKLEREALERAREAADRELDRLAAERDRIASERRAEREAWDAERQTLLNRIKPETAQIPVHYQPPSPPAVGLDEDEAFWQAKQAELDNFAQ